MGEIVAGVDGDLREHFAEQGFVRIPRLLDPEELAHFGSIVDRGVQARLVGDTRSLEEKSTYEQSFQQCLNLWEDVPEIRPLTFHPRLGAAAAGLLGVPAVRIFHDQALYKEAGGRGTDPHQDQPYWPIVEADTITAWIPLVEVDEEMGAMGYVPGSHRFGVRKYANIFKGKGLDLEEGPEARGVAPEFVPAQVGDVIFHHGLTIHTAGANDTTETRRVYTVIFFADGCTRAPLLEHPAVDRPGIAAGAPIASAVTPIAYPRPEGDLPEAPPPPDRPTPGWPGWDWARYLRKHGRGPAADPS